MKKGIVFFLMGIMTVFLLCACGGGSSKVPSYMTQELYDYGNSAIKTINDFKGGKISDEDAFQELKKITVAVEDFTSSSDDVEQAATEAAVADAMDLDLRILILSLADAETYDADVAIADLQKILNGEFKGD